MPRAFLLSSGDLQERTSFRVGVKPNPLNARACIVFTLELDAGWGAPREPELKSRREN